MSAKIKRENFHLLSGEQKLVVFSSSPGKERYYCDTCHSQIFHTQEELPELLTLKMGTVDIWTQDLDQVPKRHIFEDSDYNWLRNGSSRF
ncbi:GFA family protein [Streptococcus orisasini]|uniref:GFA family protein n=1 Tax=Streptococcus orisasini TaxID=1080071 RepID=UPI001EE71421|nr:GFA family protein [Streptococcus orisasini]